MVIPTPQPVLQPIGFVSNSDGVTIKARRYPGAPETCNGVDSNALVMSWMPVVMRPPGMRFRQRSVR